MVGLPNRRSFLKYFSFGTYAALLGACAQPLQAPPQATSAPAAAPPTSPPAAPGATSAAAPAAAPPAAATAPAAAAPQTAPAAQTGQAINIKLQTLEGATGMFHKQALDLSQKIDEMSGGRVKIDVLAGGAVVGVFDMIDGVHQGVLDAALGVPGYWFGKTKVFSLFGTGIPLGMDSWMMLGWHYYGGGNQLYNELLESLNLNVVSFFGGPMVSQPLGWFRDEVRTADQFRGLRFRTVGMAQQIYEGLGATVTALPGPEIVPALERGVLDAVEFNNPTADKLNGMADVRKIYMVGSYHQQSEYLEWLFNKQKFNAYPRDVQAMIRYAVMAQNSDYDWQSQDRHSRDFWELQQQGGVRVIRTPDAILQAQIDIWEQIAQREAAADPMFAKVLKSQQDWANRVVPMRQAMATDSPQSLAARKWVKPPTA
jgi:TRAP-type mannitol/chloroaromatic compound transport system substrate-binding protein